MKFSFVLGRTAFCVLATFILQGTFGAERTAFSLLKEANRYVGEQSKDKVVEVRSEKSIGSLTPNIWYVVLYEPDATFKAVEVKFGAGEKMSVKRPFRAIEYLNADKLLDQKKLKIDSDKAIQTATTQPLLEKLKLDATQLWLERGDTETQWRVRLWALKLRDPKEDADIGEVIVSAETGKVLKTDLHINRVD